MLSSHMEIKLRSSLYLDSALNPFLRDQACDLHAGTPVAGHQCVYLYFTIKCTVLIRNLVSF